MAEVLITINEEDYRKLKEQAEASRLTPEEYGRLQLHNSLAKEENDFDSIVEYVVRKNAELYRRLA